MKKILAIDDQKDNLTIYEAVIQNRMSGYEVLTALSGKEGIKIAKEQQPDAILLDIIMPDMDGYETCKLLKGNILTKHIPIIMITALKSDAESRTKGLNMGADAFLSKPIDTVEFTAQLNVVLRIKEAEDKLRDENYYLKTLSEEQIKKIVKSEDNYRTIFEDAYDGIIHIDKKLTVLNVNKAFTEFTGISKENVIGKSAFSLAQKFVNIKQLPKILGILKNMLLNRKVIPYELNYKKKILEIAPVKQKSGYKTAVIRDITDRKLAEEAIKESEERLKIIFEYAPDAFYLSDLKGQFLDGNAAAEEVLGFKKKELIGKSFLKLKLLSANELPKAAKALAKSVMGKKTGPDEFLLNRKDGSKVSVEISTFPVKIKGKTVILGIARDITERIKAEESLLKLSVAVEQSPSVIMITGLNGKIEYVNPKFAETTGYSVNEAIGKLPSILKSGKQSDEVYQELWQAIKSGNEWHGEFQNKKKNGELFWEAASVSPIIDKTGKVTNYIKIAEDISERKLAEDDLRKALEKAEESDRLKSAFLANMSHEIRTPMNGILGFASLLKLPNLSGDQLKKYVGIIDNSGKRMLNIINDLIDISKIEAGQMEINISECNINEQVEYLFTFFKPDAVKVKLDLSYKHPIPTRDALVKTDREKLYAILTNLLKNAIKYTHEGSIKFGYEQKGEMLEFYVKDTGIGIPADRLDAIFERFIQADIEDRRAYEGAGLGLSITKAYVKMLGGDIWVESVEGKGSQFYFTIPFKTSKKDKRVSQLKTDSDSVSPLRKIKVLIAEDDESAFEYISIIIRGVSDNILHAKTGEETIKILNKNPDVELVLMDIKMTGMDGLEATRKIRKFNREVVIIAQTAYALAGDREKSINAGCDDYITKPINKEKLMEIIGKHLKK